MKTRSKVGQPSRASRLSAWEEVVKRITEPKRKVVVGFIGTAIFNQFITVFNWPFGATLATALLTPAVTALTSKRTSLEQGVSMGLSNSFMSLGRIAGPMMAGFTFDMHIEYPNLSGALVMLAGD